MTLDLPLPPGMAERAAAFRGTPAPARKSATVVLLRPHRKAFQVYALRRHAAMVFGGVYAFPGGSVDPRDDPAGLRKDWPERLGVDEPDARAVVGAAVRELFEETGVLLASPVATDADRPASALGGPDGAGGFGGPDGAGGFGVPDGRLDVIDGTGAGGLEVERLALVRRETTLAEVLDRRGLQIRDDLLAPWARWVTPDFEPRRFDTWFFVVALPPGQDPADVSGEADRTAWIDPADYGDLPMLPPTAVTLRELAAYPSVEQALAADRDAAHPVEPELVRGRDGEVLLRISRSGR